MGAGSSLADNAAVMQSCRRRVILSRERTTTTYPRTVQRASSMAFRLRSTLFHMGGKSRFVVSFQTCPKRTPFVTSVEGKSAEAPLQSWDYVDATAFPVRGGNYLKDKIKIPSQPCAFELVEISGFSTEGKVCLVLSSPTPLSPFLHVRHHRTAALSGRHGNMNALLIAHCKNHFML